MAEFCETLPGVWNWEEDVPFPDIIEYLESFENNKSKNLKLAYIASNFHQYNPKYGLNDERKQVVKQLYKEKRPINDQSDLDKALKHVTVFVNDEHYVEEAILKEYGQHYKLRYNNATHTGLGRKLTREELKQPDFINEDGYEFEAKMCWESKSSKYPSSATLEYEIDPDDFNEEAFISAFNNLDQIKVMHTATSCFCLVKKRATFGYLVGVNLHNGKGINATLIGPLKVKFLRASPKFI